MDVLDYLYNGIDPLGADTQLDNNEVLDYIYGTSTKRKGRTPVARDEYGNTAKDIVREKAKLNKQYGQEIVENPLNLGIGTLGIPDAYSAVPEAARGPNVEISDSYASRHRYERLKKQNILEQEAKGQLGTTQYKNPNPLVDRSKPTGWLERTADSIDDSYDDVMDYIFGKTKYKNKKEKEEARLKDINLQVNEDGNIIQSRSATMNDKPLDQLRSEVMNLKDDPEGDQVIYYGRVDNPDGTHSYKIGLAGADTFGRTAKEARGKDITYLWAKRTKDAAKYEALFHGNRTLLKDRRFDIGYDPEQYGPGKSEIYNNDFLGLDGTVSMDKIETLNISTQSKMKELGVDVTGRYDARGMEASYKELEKTGRLYGTSSKEYKELEYLIGNLEHTGKHTRSLTSVPGDLLGAAASGIQQTIGSIGDTVLDAVTPGNNTLLDNWKSSEQADKTWGYRGRKETEAKGREALQKWKKGDYTGALLKGIQAAPDTLAQSLPDMALLFSGVGTEAGAMRLAGKLAVEKMTANATRAAIAAGKTGNEVKIAVAEVLSSDTAKLAVKTMQNRAKSDWVNGSKAMRYFDPKQNIGLTVFAGKQTNDQIDQRIEAGEEDVGLPTIAAMFASNYVLGGIDRIAFKSEIATAPITKMMKAISEEGMVGVAKKAAGVAAQLAKAGSTEALQEYIQTYGETINAGLNTEKYGNNPFSDHFLDEATKGALLGFGAGGLTHGGIEAGVAAVNKVKLSNKTLKKATDEVQGKEPEVSETSFESVQKEYEDIVAKHTDTDTTLEEELIDLVNIKEHIIAANDRTLNNTFAKHIKKVAEKFKTEELNLEDTTLGSKETVTILKGLQDAGVDASNPIAKANIEKLAKSAGIDANVLLSTVALNTEGVSRTEEEIGLDIKKYYTEFLEDIVIDPDGEGVKSTREDVARFLLSQKKKVTTLKHHLEKAKAYFNEGNSDPYLIPYGKGKLEYETISGNPWQINSKGGIGALTRIIEDATKTRGRLQTLDTFMNEVQGIKPATKEPSSPKPINTATVTLTTGEKIPVKSTDNLISNKDGKPLLAKHIRNEDGTSKEIQINSDKALWAKNFKDKVWTKSRKQLDNTFSKPIAKNAFKTLREFGLFVLQHEAAHNTLGKKKSGETDGEYETRVNDEAAKVLKLDLYSEETASANTESKSESKPAEKEARPQGIDIQSVPKDVIPEETTTTDETKEITTGQKILDTSYINGQTAKVKGTGKLVKDIIVTAKKAVNRFQDTSIKDMINKAKGTNKKVLQDLLDKSAFFVSETYATSKLNFLDTVEKSPMMQLLFNRVTETSKITANRTTPMVMYINAINGFTDNLDLLKKHKTKEDVS